MIGTLPPLGQDLLALLSEQSTDLRAAASLSRQLELRHVILMRLATFPLSHTVLLSVLGALLSRAPSDASAVAAALAEEPALWAYHALRRWPGREALTREPAVALLKARARR